MATARPSRTAPSHGLQDSTAAAAALQTESVAVRNPLHIAQEIRQDLLWKRDGYLRQVGWLTTVIELIDRKLKEQDAEIRYLKGR